MKKPQIVGRTASSRVLTTMPVWRGPIGWVTTSAVAVLSVAICLAWFVFIGSSGFSSYVKDYPKVSPESRVRASLEARISFRSWKPTDGSWGARSDTLYTLTRPGICTSGIKSRWVVHAKNTLVAVRVPCVDAETARFVLKQLIVKEEPRVISPGSFGDGTDLAIHSITPPSLGVAWVQGGDIVWVLTPCGQQGSAECALRASHMASSLTAALPGGRVSVDAVRNPSIDTLDRLLVGLPFAMWIVFVAPFRLFKVVSTEEWPSVGVAGAYFDLSKEVARASHYRWLRRFSYFLCLYCGVITMAFLTDRSHSGLFGSAVAGVGLVAGITLWRVSGLKLARARIPFQGEGSGWHAVLGRSLRRGASAAAVTETFLYVLVMFSVYLPLMVPLSTMRATVSGPPSSTVREELFVTAFAAFYGAGVDVTWVLPIGVVLPILLFFFVDLLGRRLSVQSADEIDDPHSFLFLRSFEEDGLTLPAPLSRRGFIAHLAPVHRRDFEEILVGSLSRVRPVITMSRTEDFRAPIGAARLRRSDEEWFDEVKRRSMTATAVVMSATPDVVNESFREEIDFVWSELPHDRVALVIPPRRRAETLRRLANFISCASRRSRPEDLTIREFPEGVHVIGRATGGPWVGFGCDRRNEISYAYCVNAMLDMFGERWAKEAARTVAETRPD
jgi:hypothetical protein